MMVRGKQTGAEGSRNNCEDLPKPGRTGIQYE